MNRQLVSPSGGSTIVNVLQPYEGGLGTTDPEEARAVLDALASTDIGVANGAAQLGSDGLINPDNIPTDGITLIAIKGPVSVAINSITTYEITNYDAFTTYDLVALDGIVKRYKNTITYEASGSSGPAGFRINGRLFAITITGNYPATPTLTVALHGASSGVVASLTSSDFAMNSGTGTHATTDWQMATDNQFNSIVRSSMYNSVGLTSMTFVDLPAPKTYYARCRYRDNSGNHSAWSSAVVFSTENDYVIDTEESKILSPSTEYAVGFALMQISLTENGTRAVIGTNGEDITGTGNEGSAYVLVRSGVTWSVEQRLRSSDIGLNDFFGRFSSISADGSRIICGSHRNDDNSVTDSGAAYIFKRTGTTWTQEAKLIASDKAAGRFFGYRCRIDASGTRAVVVNKFGGIVYVYLRSGTNWTQEARIVAPTSDSSTTLLTQVIIDSTGTRLATVVFDTAYGGATTDAGTVYIYSRTGSAWTLEATIVSPNPINNGNFGYWMSFDKNASKIVIGASGETVDNKISAGAVYVFGRNGTLWNQEAKLIPDDQLAGDMIGQCVGISDDGLRVIFSSPNITVNSLVNAGAVYVYGNNGAKWELESKISASDSLAGRNFGRCIAITRDGSRVLVGSNDSTQNTDNGAVYVYR